MQIRLATPDDAEAIATVGARGWRWAYRGLMPDAYLDSLDPEAMTAEWHRRLSSQRDDDRFWIADERGSVLGVLHTRRSHEDGAGEEDGDVPYLYVDPSHTRGGVGGALLEHALADLKGRGFTAVTLWTLDDNRIARPFYEKHGWAPDGASTVNDYGGAMLTAVRYRIELSA
jgi:GNAT superfamily N-acetyltransferase